MADIRVERKSTSIWPWLLGLALLVLAGLFLFGAFDDDNDAYITDADDTELDEGTLESNTVLDGDANDLPQPTVVGNEDGDYEVRKSIAAFTAFVDEPEVEMNLEHDYTRKGLKLLAGSLTALADRYDIEDVQLQNAKKVMINKANVLDNNWKSTDHADHIQEAFMSATKVMEQIQQKHLPGMSKEVRKVCDEAEGIDPHTLTLDQKNAVKTFFRDAADVVEQMNIQLAGNTRVG